MVDILIFKILDQIVKYSVELLPLFNNKKFKTSHMCSGEQLVKFHTIPDFFSFKCEVNSE